MRTIKFKLAAPQPDEVEATRVRVYQAEQPEGSFVEVDEERIDQLSTVDGFFTWNTKADPAFYLKMATLSDENETPRFFGQILGPVAEPADPATLEIDSALLGLSPKGRATFTAQIERAPFFSGSKLVDASAQSKQTDSNGRVSFLVPKDARVRITSPDLKIPVVVDVGGRAYVNLAEEMS